jgi:hypothetical protein
MQKNPKHNFLWILIFAHFNDSCVFFTVEGDMKDLMSKKVFINVLQKLLVGKIPNLLSFSIAISRKETETLNWNQTEELNVEYGNAQRGLVSKNKKKFSRKFLFCKYF